MARTIVVAFSVVCVSLAANSLRAAPVYFSGTGHFYEYVSDRLTWAQALSAAESRSYQGASGYLATVGSTAENEFVSSLLNDAAWAAWLGASDQDSEGTWTWVSGPETGEVFWQGNQNGAPVNGAFNNWGANEPNNLNEENALAIWGPNGGGGSTYRGYWNDFQATDTQGYVVEYVPEPTTLPLGMMSLAALCWLGLSIVARQPSQ